MGSEVTCSAVTNVFELILFLQKTAKNIKYPAVISDRFSRKNFRQIF
jgi:hypothetical protein